MNFPLPPETPEGQKKAITTNSPLITVGAGAGTGKTWVLSGRYVRLLAEDNELLPSNILTLTYTDSAASDMKLRIEDRISRELKDFDDSERKRSIYDGLSDSWISTIHSFAARLIRESGLSLDIDPAASVISAQQAQDYWDSIRTASEFANLTSISIAYGNKVLRDTANFLDSDKYFSYAVSKWGSDTLSRFARATSELHASSGHSWQEMLQWAEHDTMIDETRPSVESILRDEWLDVWNFWDNITLPEAKKPNDAWNKLVDLLSRMPVNPDNEELKHFYKRLIIDRDIKGTAKPFMELKSTIGMTITDYRDSRPKMMKNLTASIDNPFSENEMLMRKSLMKFCALSWGMWDIMKTRRGLLSFSDMITHAKRTIKKGGVHRKFSHILVDEFQDTDPLQFEMIKALSGSSDNSSLFAVGDPKQSIYKFRHAEPSLFAQTIQEADTRIELDVSFRTRSSLLKRINSIFSSLWRDGLGKSDSMAGLKYEPINPLNNNPERDSGTMPDFMILLSRNYTQSIQEARKNLADTLAAKISSWVNNGRTVWDKKAAIIRPVKFSDFAILSRSRTIYPLLEEALDKFNIPSIQDKSNDYFSRGEISDVVCMLRAAADMNDSLAVSGWLMSPFSGVSEDEALNCLKLADKTHKPIDLIRENLPDAYSYLEYLAVVGEYEGPSGLLAIYDRNRQWLSCYRERDRLRVLRNFRLSVSIAHDFQQGGTSSLTSCAEWLTRALKSELEIEEPSWHDDNENAVKLGTVHSSKGLEYPVTVIFESRTHKEVHNEPLKPSRKLGLVFSKFPDEIPEASEPQGYKWEKLLSEQGDTEEEERLFYVAATRAQDSLIFCGIVKGKDEDKPYSNTWTEFLLNNASDVKAEFAEVVDDVQSEIHDDDTKSLKPVNIIKPKNYLRQVSASSFALYEWCPFLWRRRYRQGLSLTWEITDRELVNYDEVSGGAELGSLAHWVLAQWPKSDDYEAKLDYLLNNREVVSSLPVYLRKVWRDDKKGKTSLYEWLMKFAASELGIKLRNIPNVKREYYFRRKLIDGVSMSGAIDVFFGNNIIDYKITSTEHTPSGLYESQLDFYAYVVHELTGAESVNTYTAFLREGEFAERVCDNFEDIRERIIAFSEAGASGPYNPKHKNCSSCPFKKGCVMRIE